MLGLALSCIYQIWANGISQEGKTKLMQMICYLSTTGGIQEAEHPQILDHIFNQIPKHP